MSLPPVEFPVWGIDEDVEPVRVPLRNRAGEVAAHALVDALNEHLADYRWYRDPDGYVRRVIRLSKTRTCTVVMHRLVAGFAPGDPREVDHINGNRADNRIANLRPATRAQNMQNVRAWRGIRWGRSNYRGVSYEPDRNKWRATVTLSGQVHRLGRFDTAEEADAVASAFRAKHMPFSEDARRAA